MNRNQLSPSSYNVAQANIERSKFKGLSHRLTTTFNEGDLYPMLCMEVLPGDTHSITTHSFVRMQTLIAPTFGRLLFDTYYFFIPYRLVWEHWKEFMGENTTSKWTQTTQYTIPQVASPSGGWQKGTIAQALGIRIGISNLSVNALPFRSYSLVYNDWFRSENLQDPTYWSDDDTNITGSNGNNILTDLVKGGKFAKVGRFADTFASALPEPQKGGDVLVPIGDNAPVLFGDGVSNYIGTTDITKGRIKLAEFTTINDTKYRPFSTNKVLEGLSSDSLLRGYTAGSASNAAQVTIDNAYADLSNAVGATVNQLRLAFQTQRLLERDARGGTRYNELIFSHFNVVCPDYRIQRPEYLGGSRSDINISSVVQTSQSGTTPQGTITGISATGNSNNDFTKSFTEHGLILGLCTIRVKHTYSQGMPKLFDKKNRLDFFFPVLGHIGEVGIKNKEIFTQGTSQDDEIFGYQEAWYEYKNGFDRVSGEFSPDYAQSLQSWIFTDNYQSLPYLSSTWLTETEDNVNRVVAVQSTNADQFKCNFFFDITSVRPMPLHSTPGLIDHF